VSDWSRYYLNIAQEVAKNSKCFSRHVGAVLVRNNTIIASGYNGPAKGIRTCAEWKKVEGWPIDNLELICPRRQEGYKSGEGLNICPAVHGERNTLLSAAINGIATKDSTLYAYCGVPCKDCCSELINAGVSKIVCLKMKEDYDSYGRLYLKEAKVELVEVECKEK